MPQSESPRTPQCGDTLILSDGRRFQMSGAELGPRGWWFSATAQDGGCTLQGNLDLDWDAEANVWRPAGETDPPTLAQSIPPSMRRSTATKRKQFD